MTTTAVCGLTESGRRVDSLSGIMRHYL